MSEHAPMPPHLFHVSAQESKAFAVTSTDEVRADELIDPARGMASLSTQVSTPVRPLAPVGTIKSLMVPVEPSKSTAALADYAWGQQVDRLMEQTITNPPTIYNHAELYSAWKRKAEILRTAWEMETFFENKEKYRVLLRDHLDQGVKQG